MTIDYARLDPDLVVTMKKVEERWFTSGPLGFSMGGGYDVDLDAGHVRFGLQLGPTRTIDGVLHDMGHFVTAPVHRIARDSFGMGGGMPTFCMGEVFYEHVPLVSYLNELDAMVYERILQQAIGKRPEPCESIVKSLRYMPAFYVVPGDDDAGRVAWLAAELERRASGRTVEDFDRLWEERVALLPATIAEQRATYSFLDEAVHEDLESYSVGEGCKLVIVRLSTDDRTMYATMSDVHESRQYHGEYSDVEKARARAKKILEFNGWEPVLELSPTHGRRVVATSAPG